MIRQRVLPIIGVLALAACGDTSLEPRTELRVRDVTAKLALQAEGAGTYLVLFKNDRIPSDFETTIQSLGGEVVFTHASTGYALVSGVADEGIASLGMRDDIEALNAEAQTLLGDPAKTEILTPDDPSLAVFFPRQWNMQVIEAPKAWAKNKLGSPHIRVGILDSGIDYLHPEFEGLIDLQLSKHFVREALPVGADSIADRNGHGTVVAAQVSSNANRIAGVTSRATLVSLKVCFASGTCSLGATLAAVLDAADKRLDVINLSVGGVLLRDAVKVSAEPGLIKMIEKVFKYAHRHGTTVVVAAGNSALDMDADRNEYHLYCDAPHVICVSATAPTAASLVGGAYVDIANIDSIAPYTNFGRNVDVAAPGGSLISARIWGPCSAFFTSLCASRLPILGLVGTSLAAPQVAGLAALLAVELGRHPERIAARIKEAADDFGTRGKDPYYGHGRINVAAALNHPKNHRNRNSDRDSDSDSDSDSH